MKTKFIILLFSVSFIFISCNFNQTYTNRESDRNEAAKVSEQFYRLLENNNYEEAEKLFAQKFYVVSTKKELRDLFMKAKAELGSMKSRRIADWKTKIVEGDTPISEYVLLYEVEYEKFPARETITFIKEDEEIKIFGYHIESKGLFAK